MVFSHELAPMCRGEIRTPGAFLEFCKALGWFHPLVWAAVRKAQDDLELSCDEIVLEKYDADRRKKYAELLLVTAGESAVLQPVSPPRPGLCAIACAPL